MFRLYDLQIAKMIYSFLALSYQSIDVNSQVFGVVYRNTCFLTLLSTLSRRTINYTVFAIRHSRLRSENINT